MAKDGGDTAKLGLSVRPLEPAEMQRSGLDHGLLVEQVSGPAQLAGVQRGDVLLALNGQPRRRRSRKFKKPYARHPKHVALLIERNGQQIFLPVALRLEPVDCRAACRPGRISIRG